MIFNIAKKDFLMNLVSTRFVIGFLLCLFLIPFTLFVSIDDFNEQFRVYELEKASAEKDFKEVKVYSALRPGIVKPPEPLGVFSQGISSNVGNKVKIWLGEKPLLAEGRTAIRDNPLLNSFFSIDFISILAIILSLLALIFTYDSCTGEKELGTLKMQLSNSISRYKILLGKVIGVYLTILPIILFCYILAFLLVLNYYDIVFSFNDWVRICLLFFASILFLTVFIFIGQFISTRMHTSKASIIVCLFVWVFLVFIVPNSSVYLAESFIKVQSQDNLQYALDDLDGDCWKKCDEYYKTLEQPDAGWHINWSTGHDGYFELYGATKSRMEYYKQSYTYSEPLRIDYSNKKWTFQKAYLDELDWQRSVAETISLMSPSELFRFVCSAICRTNVESQYRFMNRVRVYREVFINYLKDKKIFSSFSYITPVLPETFKTNDEVKKLRELNKYKSPNPNDYPYLDISDVPVFQLQSDGILFDVRNALFKIITLLIISIILFWLSFVSFTKYDVR
jgi:ABC-type transport system involved in multi-copper enzyme maturation permease subunit